MMIGKRGGAMAAMLILALCDTLFAQERETPVLNLLEAIVWSDGNTGIALSGYDPITYYTDDGPRLGLPEYEAVWGGVAWWFENEGNLIAFRAAPEVYAPRLGGYGILTIARNATVPGNPLIWEMWDDQLYLFHSPINREIWRRDPKNVTEKAVEVWRSRQHRVRVDTGAGELDG